MFSALADDDDEPQQQQKTVQQKKPTQQAAQPKVQEQRPRTAKPPRAEDLADFDGVTGQETRTRGGERGGRGGARGGQRGGRGGARGGRGERREGEEGAPRRGRGEYRGGRGGRGERREGEEGGFEPRGEDTDRPRGGRGRGGRGRGRPQGEGAPVEGGDEGVLYVQRKERVDFAGKDEHFQGKKSEKWHPYDRRSGTGRGREVAKGGYGKGNWGRPEDEAKAGVETTPAEEGKTEATPVEEGAEAQPKVEEEEAVEERRPREEPVEEEEEKGLTLQEFLAQKKTAGIRKEARKPEEVKKAGIEKVEKQADRVQQISSQLKDRDLYAIGRQEGADLMGFQGGDDEYPREERSGRGGRRGGRGGARGGRGGAVQGSRPQRGGQLRVAEEDFPTLA